MFAAALWFAARILIPSLSVPLEASRTLGILGH